MFEANKSQSIGCSFKNMGNKQTLRLSGKKSLENTRNVRYGQNNEKKKVIMTGEGVVKPFSNKRNLKKYLHEILIENHVITHQNMT